MTQQSIADFVNSDPAPVVAAPFVVAPGTPYEAIDAMNWSTLKLLATSAKLLRWRVDRPREDTEALERGRRIHTAVLEPAKWSRVVPLPDFGDMRTKAAKTARDEWLVANQGAEAIDADEHALCERVAASVREHPAAARLLAVGRAEQVITWIDRPSGLPCKARLDFLAPGHLADLKTGRWQSVRDIARDRAMYLDHGQLAFYLDGAIEAGLLPADASHHIIAAQTIEPYDVVVGALAPEDLDKGRMLCRRLIDRYLACRAADWWPGLAPEVVVLRLPEWAAGGAEEEIDF